MTIIDAITSSPLNVFFTFVIGLGLAYLYYRKPPSSSSSSTNTSSSHHLSRAFATRSPSGIESNIVDEELQQTIARIERQERDMIRQEQDEAYQQSLRADREKIQKKEHELRLKEAKEREDREKAERADKLLRDLTKLKKDIVDKLPSKKPDPAESDLIVKLVFKLPDGTRVKRDFLKTDRVKILYWFVFSLENAPMQFKLTTNFPKRDLPGRPPLPEDFEDTSTQERISPNDRGKEAASELVTNGVASSQLQNIGPRQVEPNCEQTLEEIQLTETQIIFVYDLEA